MALVESAVETLDIVKAVASIYDRDRAHSTRVTGLALSIFDELTSLHGYNSRERRLLEMAGILHDIGYSLPDQKPHFKTSRDLIMKMYIPGLNDLDKLTFALVTRYHTGEIPDPEKHHHFGSLPDERKEMVEWLAGILRVADALDCKHADVVRKLTASIMEWQIIFSLEVEGGCRRQIKRAHEKGDLLSKKSGKVIKYIC